LAVFNRSKTLKQSICIVQGVSWFVFVLFNLQGTVRVAARAVSLLTIAQRFPFVKNYFSFSCNFLSASLYFSPAPQALGYNIRTDLFCQGEISDFLHYF